MNQSLPITGILHGGEMGVAVAGALRGAGGRVLTVVQGRSARTVTRCVEAGIEIVANLDELVRESQVVFSLVPPSCAQEVAESYAGRASLAPKGAIFVDVNSISPEQAREIGTVIESAGVSLVDAAINGLAKNLQTSGTLFVSGERAPEIAALFAGIVRVQALGTEIGRASAMKMLLAGVSKGVCALFVELALIAHERGMTREFIEATARIYPGIMELVDRMLPTYAEHSHRRATEMRELVDTAVASSIDPCTLDAIRQLHDAMASIRFDAQGAPQTVIEFLDHLAASELLRGEAMESDQRNRT